MKISKISRLPLLVKRISLVIGLTVCASMSHAGNCGSGYLVMVGYGDNPSNNDYLLKLNPSLEPITATRFYLGELPMPTMRITTQPWVPSLSQQIKRESLTALLQTAFAGKLPVYLHSATNDCSQVSQVFVYNNEYSLNTELGKNNE